MNRAEFAERLRAEMEDVCVSPRLKRSTLAAIEGKERPVMKGKFSTALAVLIAALLVGTAALAAAGRLGMLDFAGRISGAAVPGDAQDYVQSDVLHLENELVAVDLRELYYDGLVVRMTLDVKPKRDAVMLLAEYVSMDEPFINMTPMEIGLDRTDTQSVRDVYGERGYEAAYSVSATLRMGGDEWIGGSTAHHLNEDGTLTIYSQWEYPEMKPQREGVFQLTLFPYTDALDQIDMESRIDLEAPITLTEAAYDAQTYRSTAPVEFPETGVRVDALTLEVRAQEIHATIDYTVTDEEAYAAMEDGLWFEFIDPERVAEEPYDQRLPSGMTGTGSVTRTEATGLHYRQTETLAREALYDAYTLRAFNCWDKTRYETQTVTVALQSAEP